MNEIFKETEIHATDLDVEIEFANTCEFDLWVVHPKKVYPSTNALKEEVLFSKFQKYQKWKGNNEDILSKCAKTVATHSLSEKNQVLILKLLSNLSADKTFANVIRSTDLLKWVEERSKSDSSKLFLEAWKIFQNLRSKEENGSVYLDGIYPFVPPWEKREPVADVILVHGIKGGASWTWRQHDAKQHLRVLSQEQRRDLFQSPSKDQTRKQDLLNECYTWIWPLDWLGPLIEAPFRIIAVDYPAHWWNGASESEGGTNQDLSLLSEELSIKLKCAGVGQRPIVWIAHSMGGIVVKKIIEMEACQTVNVGRPLASSPALSSLSSSTRAIVFLSVPHKGSPLASTICSFAPILNPSPYVYYMKADCPKLLTMHRSFVDFCTRQNVRVLTLNEKLPCHAATGINIMFVPSQYGNPDIGEFHEVKATHLDICKPRERSDETFRILEDFLLRIFRDLSSS